MSVGNNNTEEILLLKDVGIHVKKTGVNATVRETPHALTNHYIKMSQPYFPRKQLYPYIACGHFLAVARCLWFIGFFGFLGAVTDFKGVPLIFSIVSGVFLLSFFQHEWVNLRTLPIVRKQPVIMEQRHPNQFYEVTVTELKGVALENYRAGIGFLQLTQGKIQFQAFNAVAMETMSRAKCQSRCMLFLFLFMSAYNSYFTMAAYARWG